jgi:hypothetical protein
LSLFGFACAVSAQIDWQKTEKGHQNISKRYKMTQSRTYSVTYKVYSNARIKPIPFHGTSVFPLYIQMTFDRKTTVYKCNLFDLFLKPKYGIKPTGEVFRPNLVEIIKKEEKLIEWIIDKHPENFSLDLFKKEYDHYSIDILNEFEPIFLGFMTTFFQDEGLPSFADALKKATPERSLAWVLDDMKLALKQDLYKKLLENSFQQFIPPYPILFEFAGWLSPGPLPSLTIMDWEISKTKLDFLKFMNTHHRDKDFFAAFNKTNAWVKAITPGS